MFNKLSDKTGFDPIMTERLMWSKFELNKKYGNMYVFVCYKK